MHESYAWLSAAANLIKIIAPVGSSYIEECNRVYDDKRMQSDVPSRAIQRMYGALKAASDDWEHGLLRRVEYIAAAATFDDFLDHAAMYHKGNKKIEASVLASAVLEDSVKRIAGRNQLQIGGRSLEQLIDELVAAQVFTLVKGKRVKGFAAVRNSALHGEWDKFDIRDVGELITGTRELIDSFL
ncbi:MAG: hypothetical protein QOK37_2609 [Thermoanaerobaculia bacterium]|nr:hypothetical protein [Thermoanaerobaculia bacterium]